MEINPRFWGSLQTAVYSGVDFPELLYTLGSTGKCKVTMDYAVGKKVRWLFMGDILWFLSSKHKVKNLKEFLKFWQKDMSYDICDKDDWLPVLGVLSDSLLSLFNRGKRKHVFKRGW